MGMRKRYRTPTPESYPNSISMRIGDRELHYEKAMSLRYGENPHQPAALYRLRDAPAIIGGLELLKMGKGGLSETNVEDIDNALNILKYFEQPACAVMKHLNPSGVAAARPGDSLRDVYIRARDCDRQAAFGSVVTFNVEVDAETAEEVISTFVEVVAAPAYGEGALEVFQGRRSLRVVRINDPRMLPRYIGDEVRHLRLRVLADGSIVLSTPLLTGVRGPGDVRVVTEREPTEGEMRDLLFSWYVCMNVRSNAIVVSRDLATLGVGTGQQDRVTAVRLALEKAVAQGHGDELRGSVLASDGFFPFTDSIELMAEYGVSACIQPGGSIRDREVIEACNEYGIAMVFTDERCFRHF